MPIEKLEKLTRRQKAALDAIAKRQRMVATVTIKELAKDLKLNHINSSATYLRKLEKKGYIRKVGTAVYEILNDGE